MIKNNKKYRINKKQNFMDQKCYLKFKIQNFLNI
jgi:hypothetical protein